MTEQEENDMDSSKWCEVVNRWFTGGYVTEDEIVQLATMNLFDFCEQFRSAVRECVITFCQQHAAEWSDGNIPESWGYQLNNGAILKIAYGGLAGCYWNRDGEYRIAE